MVDFRRQFLAFATAVLVAPGRVMAQPSPRRKHVTLFFQGEGDTFEAEREYRALLAKEGFSEPGNVVVDVVVARAPGEVEVAVGKVVDARPDLVLLGWRFGTSAHAFKAATRDIPIVFTGAGDPVQSGLVASLRRPGGNLTGSSRHYPELVLKRVELFKEFRPDNPRLAVLVDKAPSGDAFWERLLATARRLDLAVVAIEGTPFLKLDALAAALRRSKAGGFISLALAESPEFWSALQSRSGVPGLFASTAVVEGGGLISLGESDADAARLAVAIAARILRGEPPSIIPVDQVTKFELAVNLGTARAMGIAVPNSILVRATSVYEKAEQAP